MADPPYFQRLPIPRDEPPGASRDRLGRQIEIHYRQREAAKARALARGFHGVTAATPVEAPFATWDEADRCPIHRFLMAEAGHTTTQPTEADMIHQAHFHFDKGPPLMSLDPSLRVPTIMVSDVTGAEPIRLGIYGLDPSRVAALIGAWNAIAMGRRVEILPLDRDAEHAASSAGRLAAEIEGAAADVMTDRDPLKLGNREKHRAAAHAGDLAREREDTAALSLT